VLAENVHPFYKSMALSVETKRISSIDNTYGGYLSHPPDFWPVNQRM